MWLHALIIDTKLQSYEKQVSFYYKLLSLWYALIPQNRNLIWWCTPLILQSGRLSGNFNKLIKQNKQDTLRERLSVYCTKPEEY